MNVLQVLPELNAGGVERTTIEMVEALCAAGHAAHVISAGGRMVADMEALGGVHHTAHIGSKNILSVPWRIAGLRRLIFEHKIDIVHARSRAPAWPAMLAARAEKVPFVTTYHGIYKAKGPLKRFYNSVMARGDHIIANSSFTCDYLIGQHGAAGRKITVIPRGVDMDQFDPNAIDETKVSKLRDSWGVKAGETALVLPARLTRWKGQLVAIEALAHLPKQYRLVLVGDAQGRMEYLAELAALGKALGVADRVHLAGHSTDMPTVLAAADIVLTPSIEPEAFGRTAAEAQAMNRPVITTDHGGAKEVVVEGVTAWRVPPRDEKALADAILRVEALSGVKSARQRISKQFSKASLQQATLNVYSRLLSSPK